jgi:hypothetical protein
MSKRRRKHNDLWVTRQGEVGFGEITLFNTDGWSEKDIALVEWAHPKDAHRVAKRIARKYEAKRVSQAEDAFMSLFKESLSKLDGIDLKAYIIDEDGVTEVDPDTDEPIK